MKKQAILAILVVFMVGLITACSKKDDTVATPASPIVGQWDINRAVLTGFPGSYTVYNGIVDSSAATIGVDSYVFKTDNTYIDTYSSQNSAGVTVTGSELGSWALAGSILTVTPTPSTGQSPQPYAFSYNGSNELTGPNISVTQAIPDPKTNVSQSVNFNVYYVYRKKK